MSGTPYPSDQERRAIQARADKGDQSARDYLELLDACIDVLESSNGISLARGLVGEHNDIYSHAIDDALSELMPVIYRISAGGWDGLKWYVPEELQQAKPERQPTGSYEADQAKARQRQAENQEYLQAALTQAMQSADPAAEARVTLQYHQAMLQALIHLTRGTDCACQPDIDALAETANELDIERAAHAARPDTFRVEEMKAFITECITRLTRVKNFCQVCHERLQYDMLENFRTIHSAQESAQ